jgi:hypothetical protein
LAVIAISVVWTYLKMKIYFGAFPTTGDNCIWNDFDGRFVVLGPVSRKSLLETSHEFDSAVRHTYKYALTALSKHPEFFSGWDDNASIDTKSYEPGGFKCKIHVLERRLYLQALQSHWAL